MLSRKFKPTAEQLEAARKLFAAMAMVQTVKPIVEAYQRKILAANQWKIAPEFVERPSATARGIEEGDVILEPKLSYLLDEEDAAVFFAECDKEAAAHGFKVKPGYCPFLIADSDRMDAERALVASMADVTKINNDNIWNLGFDKRREYLDLTMRLFAPFLKD